MSEDQPLILPPQGMSRAKDVLKIVPVCRSTLWKMVKNNSFPQPIRLSANVTVWRNSEIVSWVEQQKKA